jgi:hemerythrin-like domain-containing protein
MARRHDSLLPLTHDHHHALRNARMLRLAVDGDVGARIEATAAFLRFFRSEGVAHFREEEEVIFPLVVLHTDAPTKEIDRVLREHIVMHALVGELVEQAEASDPSTSTMQRLADLLKAHVRFEEDELFPAIEALAADRLSHISLAPRDRTP